MLSRFAGNTSHMFAIIAVVLFAIAAVIAFGALSGISVIGLIAAGLACVAMHLAWPAALPWHRQA